MRDHSEESIKKHIKTDIFLVIISITVAIFIIKSGVVHTITDSFRSLHYLGAFFAGIFFTSFFTVVPAAAVLIELAQENSIIIVSLLGGAGAVVGDYIIFRFVRDNIARDIRYVMSHTGAARLSAFFRARLFRSLTILTGAFVLASPIPDEIGLAMMGISGIRTSVFLPISFSLHTAGIFVIGLLGGAAVP